ncbi:hypothetical protein Q31a_07650 [Aureliella helgolandensis]|uniref:Uncharacterized protein n=1 Tax=Aureliella helgolandensis TaxID=2527968 RepID=A0A518G1J6_9BACT|nr:hypothetical protein Q31a_07650 [Aureliella helgolandensis]
MLRSHSPPKKLACLMVQTDLERTGIDYRTEEGIADFHTAGRHSHLMESLRSGVTVPQGNGTCPPQ